MDSTNASQISDGRTQASQSACSTAERSSEKSSKCHPANVSFYNRLADLSHSALIAGKENQARSFARAMQSLQRYPLALTSAHDAMLLDGMGKVVASIFQEGLENSSATEGVCDDHAWRNAMRRRLLREMGRRAASGGPSVVALTKPRTWGRWRKTRQSRGHGKPKQENSQHPSPIGSKPSSCGEPKEQQVQLVPISMAASSEKQVPAVEQPPVANPQAKPNGFHVQASGRRSLAASCRQNAAARIYTPATGSAGWCLLVSLGLYASDSSDKALSQKHVQRCIDTKLRPEVSGCKTMHWSVADRLKTKGLVEVLAENRYRLTSLGSSVADALIRKLEIPLTALSPLRVSQAKSSETCADIDEDDQPLSMLVLPKQRAVQAMTASPQQEESELKPLMSTAVVEHRSQSSSKDVNVFEAAFASRVENHSDLHLSQFAFQALVEHSAPPEPQKKKKRRLGPSLSAPASLSPRPKSPKRRLAPVRSAPTPPRAAAATAAVHMSRPSCNAKLVLLLDHREIGASREHKARGALLEDLRGRMGEVAVEARSLPLGDVLWIWRDSDSNDDGLVHEFIAGWIVERKTFSDLSSSVMDGRYDEQKIRLLEAPGLDGVVYLIEGSEPLFGVGEVPKNDAHSNSSKTFGRGFGQRLISRTLPIATLSTTAVHTQFISGFHVTHSTSTAHTLALLEALHENLRNRGPLAHDMSKEFVQYGDFAERTRKSCHARVFDAFGKMLRMVPSCGPEATEAIVDEFQTPHALASALRDNSDKELLTRLKERRGGRTPVTANTLAACRELFVE